MESHQRFARDAVAAAELVGAVVAHVAATDDRGEPARLVEIVVQRHRAVDLYGTPGTTPADAQRQTAAASIGFLDAPTLGSTARRETVVAGAPDV